MKDVLTAKERVALAGYLLTGDEIAAYQLLRPNGKCSKENLKRMAARWTHGAMQREYLQDLKSQLYSRYKEKVESNEDDLTNKDNLLRALQAEYRAATDGKQRADILSKIATITAMAKEQDIKTDEDRIHYFLPEDCDNCPYNPANKKNE